MNFENEKDERIVNEILKVLKIEYLKHKYFNDGASSRVILLNGKYLIKQNTKLVLESELEFFKYNNSSYFQKIIYVDPNYEYIVYDFIEGETMHDVKNPYDTIDKIIYIANNYSNYDKPGYGYLDELEDSWSDFFKSEIYYSSENLKEYISDTVVVDESVKILEKYDFDKKIIHGDFGTHNFIKKDEKLVGVIDPMGVIGDSLYDILFAIVSNIDLLNVVNLEYLSKILPYPLEKIKAMLTIVLYSRISRCLKYHPQDINDYMKFWNTLTK